MCNFQDFSKKDKMPLRFQATTKKRAATSHRKSGAKGRFTMIPMKPLHQQQIQGRVLRWPHLKKNGGRRHTPPKFNIEPENGGFQKGSPFPVGHFQVPC